MTRGKSCFKREKDKVGKKCFLFFSLGAGGGLKWTQIMFNAKKKVRRTWKKNFDNCYGYPRRNFEKTAVNSQATKNNRFRRK